MIWAAAQGKVNLHFQVGELQSDGYHPVVSLYQALDLEERVGVETSATWSVEVVSQLPNLGEIPLDESNLVVKAAKALAASVGINNPQPMHFEIHKRVPVAGGWRAVRPMPQQLWLRSMKPGALGLINQP